METNFAPAERATDAEFARAQQAFARMENSGAVLDAMLDWAVALNRYRQIIAVSTTMLRLLGTRNPEDALRLRPGEALVCVHSNECPGGCGTSTACSQCGAVHATLECLATRQTVDRECRITTRGAADGGSLDLRVRASYVEPDGEPLVLLALRDISGEKRREVLERAFLDVLRGRAITVHHLAQLAGGDARDDAPAQDYTDELLGATRGILDQLEAYRTLRAAEQNTLPVRMDDVYVPDLIDALAETYRSHPLAEGRTIVRDAVAPCIVSVDTPLATRAIGNLIENAIEATTPGGAITLRARETEGQVEIEIHNDAVIPPDVQLQIFQRSFSTKGSPGRGIGAYAARLYVERYLNGRVMFESNEAAGTTFRVTLPARPA